GASCRPARRAPKRDSPSSPTRPNSPVRTCWTSERGQNAGACRHCERSEAIHAARQRKMDCFSALAMTRTQLISPWCLLPPGLAGTEARFASISDKAEFASEDLLDV